MKVVNKLYFKLRDTSNEFTKFSFKLEEQIIELWKFAFQYAPDEVFGHLSLPRPQFGEYEELLDFEKLTQYFFDERPYSVEELNSFFVKALNRRLHDIRKNGGTGK